MIFVDVREPNRIVETLKLMGIEVKRKKLDVADYLVAYSNYVIAIERKDADDYLNSIIDGRFFDQMYNMSKSYELSFLFIVGDLDFGKFRKEAFLGSLLSVSLKTKGKVVPIQVSDEFEFCTALRLLNSQIESGRVKAFPMLRKARVEDSVAMLTAIPGIGVEKARRLLEKFGSIYNIVNASISDLMKVEGIGEKQARRIYNFVRGRIVR